MVDLDAIVVATDAASSVRVAGLTARERARRVAIRVGATRVFVVEQPAQLAELVAWRSGRKQPLLVVRANQLVHTPLVAPLIEALPVDGIALAIVPHAPAVGDLTVGAYAGAFVAVGDSADQVVAALAASDVADDNAIVAKFPHAARVPHGAIARAPLGSRDEIRAAHRLLYRILIKPQDNAVTRYLYRPISFPLTRLLVWTPITPNQVSYVVAMLSALGCYFTASASMTNVLIGSLIVLAATYLDCCDGEIARVKLLSSKYGAWIDTIVDELSSVGYMIAIGWHCHLYFGPNYFGALGFDPWTLAIAVTTPAFFWAMYCIYYNIIVAVGSANSQDYVGRFVEAPGREPNHVRLAPAPVQEKKPLPQPIRFLAMVGNYMVRRDFICWLAVILAATHLTHVTFALFVLGGLLLFPVLTLDHVKLRQLRRSIVRRGMLLEAP